MRLEGKVAIVTGAASGTGRATAVCFAQEGARVLAADVNEEGLRGTVTAIEAADGAATAVRCEVTVEDDVRRLVARAVLFLASDDASFVAGTALFVDGSLTAH